MFDVRCSTERLHKTFRFLPSGLMSTNKNVLTDLSSYDTEALKARLSALRRYL